MTQFGRALSELNIEILCANSSQAINFPDANRYGFRRSFMKFIQYIAPQETHDAEVMLVNREGSRLLVQLRSPEGQKVLVVLSEIDLVNSESPEGMLIYSISEMESDRPSRRFVFVNAEEESTSSLEVYAKECSVSVV